MKNLWLSVFMMLVTSASTQAAEFPKISKENLARIMYTQYSKWCLTEKPKGEPCVADSQAKSYQNKVYQTFYWGYLNINKQLPLDLTVTFSWENFFYHESHATEFDDKILGFQTLANGFTFFGVIAGGDWESGVHHIYYWDGEQIRIYIPYDGNPYNSKMKTAYGNYTDEEEAGVVNDYQNIKDRFHANYDPHEVRCNQVQILKELRRLFR